jgi:hypothetical protein
VIDGIISPGEWPSIPQLVLNTPTYPIQTNFYCKNNATDLYILVDALGDTTNDNVGTPCDPFSNDPYTCDECLLVFGDMTQPTNYLAEVWGKTGEFDVNTNFPNNAEVALGLNGHRFYEWRIPLASINAAMGELIDFSSPAVCKGGGSGESCIVQSSMPFDGSNGNDNEWPPGVDDTDRESWGSMQLNDGMSIPTMTQWGMIIFVILAGVGAVYYIRRQKRAER